MCKRVNCRQCGKPTWAGCGAHVEQVLGDVPTSERCQCGSGVGAASKKKGILGSLFGR